MIWWNQTGAASAVATRRVSRSLCCAWKKRGEGRASNKATGTPGSNTLVIVSNQYHFGGSFCLDAGIIRRNASLSRCSAIGGGVGESGSKRRWWRIENILGRLKRDFLRVFREVLQLHFDYFKRTTYRIL